MTDAQSEICLAAQNGPAASNTFLETWLLDLDGPFDVPSFREAVQELIARHDSLRSAFTARGDSIHVAAAVSASVTVTNLSDCPDPDAGATAILNEETRTPFDLTTAPLIRIRVLELAHDRHWVVLTAHTVVCDSWSSTVLLRELAALYTARVRDVDADLRPAPSFPAYAQKLAERISGSDGERIRAYWRHRFAVPPPYLELPTDRPRPARWSYTGASVTVPMDQELAVAIHKAADRTGVTPQVWFLAALHALLHRLTGQTDVVVATVSEGQTRAGEADLVGHRVDLLPIRAAVETGCSFRELVEVLKQATHDAGEHGPFNYLSSRWRNDDETSGHPLHISATFEMISVPGELDFGDTRARVERKLPPFVNFDVQVTLAETGADFSVSFAYNADLYDRATVARWAGHYQTLLSAAVANPNTAVGRLPLLSPAEFRQLITEFNNTEAEYPRDRQTHELIAEQAARSPNRVAVEARGERLTYSELERRANQLAHYLQELGVGPDIPVGLCVKRSVEMVVAMLAIWKAGGAYLPLDPDFPAARLKLYLEDSGAPVVITQRDLRDQLPVGAGRVVDLDADRDAIAARPAESPRSVSSPANLAYLIYTSGSTGTPNGVAVEHRALVNLLTSLRSQPGLNPDDVVAAITTMSFDIHHVDLWLPLLVGARVHVLTRDFAADAVQLAAELERTGATVLQATPATWRLLMTAGWPGRPGLKAFCGGEAMPPELAAYLLDRVAELWNLYGPTETTVYSVIHRVEAVTGLVPIGRPIANTQVYILDRLHQPVPIGCIGELYISGDGLARGYRNRAELTATRFVENPFRPGERMYKTGDLGRYRTDGVIECLGRIDHQVKVSGHRIELGEVESALATHPSVAAAAARIWGQPPQLAAYIVTHLGHPQSAESIRQYLRDRLPGYMVPGLVTFVDALPLTPNGKIDRRALPEPVPAIGDQMQVLPRTDAERAVLAVYAEVLGRPDLGVTDDFFELGGTSLQAGEVVGLIRRRHGHAVPLGALYEAPTVEKLAGLIQHRLEAGSPGCLVPLQTGGSRPPLFMIAGIGGHVFTFHKFARTLGPDYPVYGLKAIGVDGGRRPPDRIEEIAAEYVGEIIAAQPRGPYLISGYSIGALVALEVALQLQALGHAVPLIIVFDMPAPGYPPPLSVPRRLVLHARNLFRREGGGLRYAVGRFRNLGKRALRLLGLERLLFPRHPSLNALPQEALRDVWVALQRAARKYRPRGRLDSTVALFRSEVPLDVWNAVVHTDPHLGWGERTTGPVEVQPVSRGHLEVFHESNIDWLARRVAGLIERSSNGSPEVPPPGERDSRRALAPV